jgi:hypothetical protein
MRDLFVKTSDWTIHLGRLRFHTNVLLTRGAAQVLYTVCVKLLCCASACAGTALINCFPRTGVSSTLRQLRLAKPTTKSRPHFSRQLQDVRRELRGDQSSTVAKPCFF